MISRLTGRSLSEVRTARALTLAALTALLLGGAATGVAQARIVRVDGRAYAEMLTPHARAASSIRGPVPLTFGGPQQPVEYGGGPLMISSKLYLIFWEGSKSFPTSYSEPIVEYAKDLHADESLSTDELSVAEQYANGEGTHISGDVSFGGAVFDTTPYPAVEGGCKTAPAPCVTDKQIQAEILSQIKANSGWTADSASAPEAQYLVYTPEGVATCIAAGECSTDEYCAYHGELTGIGASKQVAVYSDLPDVPECDSGQAPAGAQNNKDTDGTLDSEIHELVESATDPAADGSGYIEAKEGNEVADKCTEPIVSSQPDIYGAPLGGSLSESTAFNQLIDGHSYYTQQIWSNAATQTPASPGGEPAGCVARIGPTPAFTAPAGVQTGQAASFDASGSYDIGAPIAAYAWNFGDGSPVDTTSASAASHVYTAAGTYEVSLTVTDGTGAANASTQTQLLAVGGATPPPPTTPILAPTEGSGLQGASSGTVSGGGSNSGSTPPQVIVGKSAKAPTRAQQLAKATAACHRLRRSKRAKCVAAARKRFAPKQNKHKPKPKSKRR